MTELTEFQRKLTALLPGLELRFQEPMSRHTSFRIGGPAEVMAFPKNVHELKKMLESAASLHCRPVILGAGTNVLAPDEGLKGLVICLKDCLSGMELLDDHTLRVMAGVTMNRAAVFAANHGLTGLEFAHGIPGTVGGGVYMNAGAYGGEISQVCKSVEIMLLSGEIITFSREDMKFSYRHTVLEEQGGIVISATFVLEQSSVETVKAKMQELIGRRTASQPLNLPSAGSAFKRPASGYAAALIDQAGLKGLRVGDAAVSEKHAGFVVNLGNASAADVKQLLQQVSDTVFERFAVRLEPEVRIW